MKKIVICDDYGNKVKEFDNLYDMVTEVECQEDWEYASEKLWELFNRPFDMIGKYSWDDIVDAIDPDAGMILFGADKEKVMEDLWNLYQEDLSNEYEKKLLTDYYINRR